MKRLLLFSAFVLLSLSATAQPRVNRPEGERDSTVFYIKYNNHATYDNEHDSNYKFWQFQATGKWQSYVRLAGGRVAINSIEEFDGQILGYAFYYTTLTKTSGENKTVASYSGSISFENWRLTSGSELRGGTMKLTPSYYNNSKTTETTIGGLVSPENYEQLANIQPDEQVDLYFVVSARRDQMNIRGFLAELHELAEAPEEPPVHAMSFLRTTDGETDVIRYCYIQDGKPVDDGFHRAYYEMSYPQFLAMLSFLPDSALKEVYRSWMKAKEGFDPHDSKTAM